MRDSVSSARYSIVCNVLRQWRIWLIPTYRVYRLYDIVQMTNSLHYIYKVAMTQNQCIKYISILCICILYTTTELGGQ